jgi:LPP20 lipoprotein
MVMTKAIKLQMTVLGLLLVTTGCASQKPMGQEAGGMGRVDTPIQNVEGLPEWVTQKGAAFSGERKVLYGVGSASGVRNPTLRRRAAEGQARNDLAATLNVYVAGLQKQYLAETTAGDLSQTSVEQHIQDTMKQVTEASLVGAEIVEYWEHPLRNEAYALCRLDIEKIMEAMESYAAADGKFKELDAKMRDWVRKNADKAHSELNEELQKKK